MFHSNGEREQQLVNYVQEQSKNLYNSDLKRLISELLSTLDSFSEHYRFEFSNGFNLLEHVQQYEADIIRHALRLTRGKQRAAAKLLGIKHTTLNMKIKRYRLDAKEISN
jgi:DNA-binding NtrC family response regulator